jgi:hypothetical protein
MAQTATNTRLPHMNTYMWLMITAGAVTCAWSAINLPFQKFNLYLPVLVVATVFIGSRVAIRIPRINTNITVDDTFIFVVMLLYGGETAILLGMFSGIAAGLRISKRPRTVLFAGASLACALSITAQGVQLVHTLPWLRPQMP